MNKIFAILFVCFTSSGFAQIHFPEDYLGIWKGTLVIYASGTEIPMSLQIGPEMVRDSIYAYTITYETKTGPDVRRYELHVVDRQKGYFWIDEKNGIILDEKLLGNKLGSVFSVSGSTLLITLELLSDTIVFEVYAWPSSHSRQTEAKENGETYTVNSYLLNGYQKAILTR